MTTTTPTLLEICIDSYDSAVAAIRGSADRLELCAALSEGGLTPTVGLLREVRKFVVDAARPVHLYAMIRCRRGSDFCFSDPELAIMVADLRLLAEHGADGFVFGALTEQAEIHREHCRLIAEEALRLGKPVTFHRAFDCTAVDRMGDNLRLVGSLGFTTILTSGFESTAVRGLDNIQRLAELAKDLATPITIMPGSGVSPANARDILQQTGCRAVHASARSASKKGGAGGLSMGGSAADGEGLLVCDEEIVREIRKQIN
uniref:Copper homeostasis protein cutC homolog n=1 Tax=Culex pipiens TaxID=7175 RepID=A0A8D8CTY1_CULPI